MSFVWKLRAAKQNTRFLPQYQVTAQDGAGEVRVTYLKSIEPDIERVHVGRVLSEIGRIDFGGKIPRILDDVGGIFDTREFVAFLFGYRANIVGLVCLTE